MDPAASASDEKTSRPAAARGAATPVPDLARLAQEGRPVHRGATAPEAQADAHSSAKPAAARVVRVAASEQERQLAGNLLASAGKVTAPAERALKKFTGGMSVETIQTTNSRPIKKASVVGYFATAAAAAEADVPWSVLVKEVGLKRTDALAVARGIFAVRGTHIKAVVAEVLNSADLPAFNEAVGGMRLCWIVLSAAMIASGVKMFPSTHSMASTPLQRPIMSRKQLATQELSPKGLDTPGVLMAVKSGPEPLSTREIVKKEAPPVHSGAPVPETPADAPSAAKPAVARVVRFAASDLEQHWARNLLTTAGKVSAPAERALRKFTGGISVEDIQKTNQGPIKKASVVGYIATAAAAIEADVPWSVLVKEVGLKRTDALAVARGIFAVRGTHIKAVEAEVLKSADLPAFNEAVGGMRRCWIVLSAAMIASGVQMFPSTRSMASAPQQQPIMSRKQLATQELTSMDLCCTPGVVKAVMAVKSGPEPLGTREIVKRLVKLHGVYGSPKSSLEETVQAALEALGGTYEALRRLLTLPEREGDNPFNGLGGWIYGYTDPEHPEWFKVGFTRKKLPERRIQDQRDENVKNYTTEETFPTPHAEMVDQLITWRLAMVSGLERFTNPDAIDGKTEWYRGLTWQALRGHLLAVIRLVRSMWRGQEPVLGLQ